MSAGRISLWFNGGGNGNLHLVFLDALTNLPFEFIQTPDNVWGTKNPVPDPDRPSITFQAIKLIQGVGSVVMLIGLDTGGRLWYTTSNDNGGWATNFTRLPNEGNVNFTCFDAVTNVNEGIVVVASGQATGTGEMSFTQSTKDGVTWSQPWGNGSVGIAGWSNTPNQSSSYSYGDVRSGIQATETPFYPTFPPTFSNVAISNNSPESEGDSAPVIAGLTSVFAGPSGGGWLVVPLVLYTDTDGNWQWSLVPSVQITSAGAHFRATWQVPPYPVPISDLHLGPVLLLVGADGNVYYDTSNGGLMSSWSYSGSLPNVAGLSISKAKVSDGFPMNAETGTGALVVVVINSSDGFPYFFQYEGYTFFQPNESPNANWQYMGQLPPLNPAKKVVDFDIAFGISALQVAYLAEDGSLYVNFQVQDGGWGVFPLS
jgi:hypothetical protein